MQLCEYISSLCFCRKNRLSCEESNIINNKTGTVFSFIPGFLLTWCDTTLLKKLFPKPWTNTSQTAWCSACPSPRWWTPSLFPGQTSAFTGFLSYIPWLNLLAFMCCFVQSSLKILNYHGSYLQTVSHCAPWAQNTSFPTSRIYSRWWNKRCYMKGTCTIQSCCQVESSPVEVKPRVQLSTRVRWECTFLLTLLFFC